MIGVTSQEGTQFLSRKLSSFRRSSSDLRVKSITCGQKKRESKKQHSWGRWDASKIASQTKRSRDSSKMTDKLQDASYISWLLHSVLSSFSSSLEVKPEHILSQQTLLDADTMQSLSHDFFAFIDNTLQYRRHDHRIYKTDFSIKKTMCMFCSG